MPTGKSIEQRGDGARRYKQRQEQTCENAGELRALARVVEAEGKQARHHDGAERDTARPQRTELADDLGQAVDTDLEAKHHRGVHREETQERLDECQHGEGRRDVLPEDPEAHGRLEYLKKTEVAHETLHDRVKQKSFTSQIVRAVAGAHLS